MSILQKIFGKLKTKKRSKFSIEYYPITNAYYPKYKDRYLQKDYQTGIIKSLDDYLFMYANSFKTSLQAEKFIELFKEQQLKENVITIEV